MSATQRIGKYAVLAALAKGPQGTVFRGEDADTRRAVAIKAIPRAFVNEASIAAFRKYSAALARIDHPCIAAFVDLVESDKAVYVVSELCQGKALSALLKDDAYPDHKGAWDIARQLLEALAFAHVKGVVHRDLKPANLMLAADGRLKVTDFGLALLRNAPPGDVHYLAPEQFDEGLVSARTDLYQVGAIAYQLITGKLPFTGTPDEIAHRVLQERATDPSSYNNRIAWQLDWVIQKALGKDPAERFGTAAEFAEGLRLGLQDTVGRPLQPLAAAGPAPSLAAAPPSPTPSPRPSPRGEGALVAPVKTTANAAAVAPAKAGAQLLQNAQALAAAKPAAAPSPSPRPSPKGAGEADARKPRVLFIDDDERILNGLKALFRQEYDILTAGNGAEGLELVKRFGVHVIVSDQRMPNMTGVEVLRKVRTLAPNAVRILLTGYTDLAALVGSINEGEIFRFVKKPWDNDELRAALADAAKIALELANSAPPRVVSPRSAGSLLVIDPNQSLARGLERLLAGAATVRQVATPAEAAEVLKTEEIAAIVADLGAGMDGLVALFKQVKAKRPEILSILLADEPDSELGIELINKAHIFRFLPKPVSARELRSQVAAALRRYAAFRQIPTLESPAAGKAGSTGSAVAERARALPRPPLARTA
jgi:eukaryotic-like serine/threonine-protein kinase